MRSGNHSRSDKSCPPLKLDLRKFTSLRLLASWQPDFCDVVCSLPRKRRVAHLRRVKLAGPYDFDVAIIGGGSAGFAAARTAAGAGLRTLVLEGGEKVGGLCILRGCMPTKTLLYAAEVMHLVNHAETWGVRVEKAGFDFARVMARKNALIKDFADYRRQQLESGQFEFVRADARFIDPHTLELFDKPLSPSDGERVAGRPGEGRARQL